MRAYSKGNRQKVLLIAALMTRADLLVLDEPTTGLDPLMEQAFRSCVREAKERGQTVFLSSHILSEVEALCDRVAILRTAGWSSSGHSTELRHLSALSVDATFAGAVPDLSGVPGVGHVHVDDHGARLERARLRGAAARRPGRHRGHGPRRAASPRSRSSSWPTTGRVTGRVLGQRDR